MPRGFPVATLAIGGGAANAGLMAAAILALSDAALAARLRGLARGTCRPRSPRAPAMTDPLPAGAAIGILGGGQLGRMLSLAAARLGYTLPRLRARRGGPGGAGLPPPDHRGLCRRGRAWRAFAAAVDVVTYEFENVPAAALEQLAASRPIRPGPRALAVSQDRLAEKTFLADLGLATAPFAAVDDAAELDAALAEIGAPAILKTRRLGYDGKGQARLRTARRRGARPWRRSTGRPSILEGLRPLRPRGLGHRRARPRRHGRRLRARRERARGRHPAHAPPCPPRLDAASARDAVADRRADRSTRSTMSASSGSSCS